VVGVSWLEVFTWTAKVIQEFDYRIWTFHVAFVHILAVSNSGYGQSQERRGD
jgi:hypothetical protein